MSKLTRYAWIAALVAALLTSFAHAEEDCEEEPTADESTEPNRITTQDPRDALPPQLECSATLTNGHTAELIIDGHDAHLAVIEERDVVLRERTFQRVEATWSGHIEGYINGRNFELVYESHYGCIKNVTLTAALKGDFVARETLHFDACRTGTSRDRVCFSE